MSSWLSQILRTWPAAVAFTERALHDHAVDPAAELEAHRPQCAGVRETEAAMERDRAGIRAVADHCDHLTPPSTLAARDQLAKKRRSDALATHALGDVDRVLDGVAVGGPRAIARGVAVA